MPVHCSPTDPSPTHHISLQDRKGQIVGLILCDTSGNQQKAFSRTPVDRTALKTTTGNSQYSDMQYPYSPIVEDDWSGGRGSLDFERDGTKFLDSFRVRTSMANKAFLGPQEQYSQGNRNQNVNIPGNVNFEILTINQRYLAYRFQANASFTVAMAWLLARKKGSPKPLTVAIYSDNSGTVGAVQSYITVTNARMADILSEWLDETMSQALTSGVWYWLVVYGDPADNSNNCWSVAVKPSVGSTYFSQTGPGGSWNAATFDLYFRLTDSNPANTCILTDYKEQQYAFVSPPTGAPHIYMNGDRGTADSNAGFLNKLIDGSKNWAVNQWVGCVVEITNGTGKLENVIYRTITANDATSLTCDSVWTIQHDTTTEYVILGSNLWHEITGHGLTAPVTDLLVSTAGVIYVCMGDVVNVRRLQAVTAAGVWTDFDNGSNSADEGTTKATYIIYKPQSIKIAIGNNVDANGMYRSR